ncbi:MAG: nucleotidyltransferase domain-containing protein [Candidatus Nomurabacteria bacterium]|jgi:predicted nucleotidyltransferase|nr:nucleotidyltransferase domain-containing protein [Candidatus Nomurabacteria bacterium]
MQAFAKRTKSEIQQAVAAVAPKYPVKSVRLFGSYADGTATEESDVDLLVELDDSASLGDLMAFQGEMKDLLKKPIDVVDYPIDYSRANYSNFRIKKEVLLYGRDA